MVVEAHFLWHSHEYINQVKQNLILNCRSCLLLEEKYLIADD